jgi:hypothetical protein
MACDIDSGLLRAAAIVLQERVNDLKAAVDAVHVMTSGWVLDKTDAYLPSPSSVKAQVLAYEALKVWTLTLSDSLNQLKRCDLEIPDHIVIPQEGITIPPDGSFSF